MNLPSALNVTPLAPRARRSTSVADNLRTLVGNGTLKAGDKLPTETMLCAQFGVSRTTLREAIQMLRTSGLLDVCPGRGSFVRLPDISQIVQELVLACGQHGSGISAGHIGQLRLLLQREALSNLAAVPLSLRQQLFNFIVTREATPADNALAEEQWHLAIQHLAGNPLQIHLLSALLAVEHKSRLARYHKPDEVLRTLQTQLRINTAITEGDAELATRALTQFISMGQDTTHITPFPLSPTNPAPKPKSANE